MAGQTQIQKPAPQETKTEAHVEPVIDEKTKLKEEMDAILDDIDAVLEENAEEFVRNYVQKGGQ